MMTTQTRILRAAWALPVTSPPIEDAEVVLESNTIVEVRASRGLSGPEVEDFGAAILLPGLVNVHTHLDYTLMRGLLEDVSFFPWIRELTARAFTLTTEDWQASAAWGAAEALASGISTIGDCTFSGAAMNAARSLGLNGRIYQEVFGIDALRTTEGIVQELRQKVEKLKRESAGTRLEIGISPHAPYTVRPDLFTALAEYAREEKLAVCIHAAESHPESDLLRNGAGPFAEMFAARGIRWENPGMSTVAYLDRCGILGPDTLLVHGVQISVQDRNIMRQREAAWAHCPKSNAKLGNGVAPLDFLRSYPDLPESLSSEETGDGLLAGREKRSAKIGLGSDSVASNNTMDMFEEMRFAVLMQRAARRKIEGFGAREAVAMATRGGAEALGMEHETGSLEPGKQADLCVVRLNDLHSTPAYDPYNALVYASRASDVIATCISGEWRYDTRRGEAITDRFPHFDLRSVRAQFLASVQKMRDWRPKPS